MVIRKDVVKIKLMGSKSRIAKYIVPIIQKCIDDNNLETYIEPFVGGCNVIDKIKCKSRYGYDKNKYLIALFKHLQSDSKLLPDVSRELYERSQQYRDIKKQFEIENDSNISMGMKALISDIVRSEVKKIIKL